MNRVFKWIAVLVIIIVGICAVVINSGWIKVSGLCVAEESVSCINVVNGNSGETIIVNNTTEIHDIVNFINGYGLSLGVPTSANGWKYFLHLKNELGDTILKIYIISATEYSVDRYLFYTDTSQIIKYLEGVEFTMQ